MAHYAELNQENKVLRVLVVDNSIMTDSQGREVEELGIQYLKGLFGEDTNWKQTSYNTIGGFYFDHITREPDSDQSKAFRKNYAGLNYSYDTIRDAFIPPKPEGEEWILDENSCRWIKTE